MKRILIGLAALSVVISAGMAGGSILERNRFVKEIENLREELYQARFSVDSCKMSLAFEEQEFLLFDQAVDSLHAVVRGYEDEGQGGVPEAEYPEYLEVFEAYNDSVAAWDGRAAALQATEDACRRFVEGHNSLSDSLRRRLQAGREG